MRSAYRTRSIVIIVAFASLAGCTTSSGGKGTGSFLSSSSNSSTVFITSLNGGIVARSGVQLSKDDRERALEAEYRALEAAPGGQPVAWAGSNVSGQVVAAAPYQVGAQNCRQYTHKINTNGREVEARGAACRNKNGSWTPLT
ncbi:hypothetical protein ACQQ2Q_02040 [Agrobacterium sp. ES01]|uniref:hypothetical protein n=1 Tax=Agrobacterium sp. ES01 TaxID=3420714 RepID=UPI003D0EB756